MKNEVLFEKIKSLVGSERRIGVEILELLHEIDRRKAYAELRYDGLYTYCVKELGFSESQAYQRIQAMRALKELPELKTMIEAGSLSVSNIAKAQAYFRKENETQKKSGSPSSDLQPSEKMILFHSLENRTTQEADEIIAERNGETLKRKIVIELDTELAALWSKVKGISAHRTRGQNAEILRILAQEWLRRNDPARKVAREKPTSQNPTGPGFSRQTVVDPASSPVPAVHAAGGDPNLVDPNSTNQRAVPRLIKVVEQKHSQASHADSNRAPSAQLKREVWRKHDSSCALCKSQFALEVDHIEPFGLGGETREENLRLLCRSCNQAEAVRIFGLRKISREHDRERYRRTRASAD